MSDANLAYYDQRCFSLTTAIRAVWLLFLRGKWDLLEEVGVDKETHNPLFMIFMFEFVGNNARYHIRNQAEARALVLLAPKVLDAAIELSGRYAVVMSPLQGVAE